MELEESLHNLQRMATAIGCSMVTKSLYPGRYPDQSYRNSHYRFHCNHSAIITYIIAIINIRILNFATTLTMHSYRQYHNQCHHHHHLNYQVCRG